eukprot:TRINITY_DN16155_c0_g1_i1.p1 TRINITY_DN16155_c0_g1~~TRINITY_DN16155_c0_g1_i1.p1  ORF type:complete len:455 (+),score=6.44 TRINITY_DN16155_c0_g1_i1:189-1553(+)
MSGSKRNQQHHHSLAPKPQPLWFPRNRAEQAERMIRSLRLRLAAILGAALLFTFSTRFTQRLATVPEIFNQIQTLNFTLQRVQNELASTSQGRSQARPRAGVFNSTLLSYAALELGEADEKQKISNLLETATLRRRYYRRGVPRHDSEIIPSSASVNRRRRHSAPIQIFHPRFAPFLPEFRRILRSWVSSKRYDPRVMAELLELVKSPLDHHFSNISGPVGASSSSQKRFGSCAVVGNSGILLQESHGDLIDSHEFVIRLNNARTAGFRNSVGSKTNLSFVNSNILNLCSRRSSCHCHPYGESVPIIMYICQAVHFMDYAYCSASHKAPLLVTDGRFDKLCARIVKYYSLKNFVEKTGKGPEEWGSAHEGAMFHYSSGMQAVMLALGICDRVSLFGFGKSPSAKHHYHTNQKAELPLHDYEAEYQLYHDLATRSPNIPFLGDAGIDLPPLRIYL